MSRRIAVFVVLTLMAGSSAFGGILQGQGYAVGTDNMIHLTQGDQSAQSSQDLVIDISQNVEGTGLALVSGYAYSISSQRGSGLGALGLIGVGQIHVISVGGLGGVIAPAMPGASSATLQLAQARLNGIMLLAN